MSELLKPLTNISSTSGIGKRLNAVTAGLSDTSKNKGLVDTTHLLMLEHYTE